MKEIFRAETCIWDGVHRALNRLGFTQAVGERAVNEIEKEILETNKFVTVDTATGEVVYKIFNGEGKIELRGGEKADIEDLQIRLDYYRDKLAQAKKREQHYKEIIASYEEEWG